MKDRIAIIQNNTAELLRNAEAVQVEAIDAINAAKAAGATDEQLKEAWGFPPQGRLATGTSWRREQHRLPQPAGGGPCAGELIDTARQAQLSAERLMQ